MKIYEKDIDDQMELFTKSLKITYEPAKRSKTFNDVLYDKGIFIMIRNRPNPAKIKLRKQKETAISHLKRQMDKLKQTVQDIMSGKDKPMDTIEMIKVRDFDMMLRDVIPAIAIAGIFAGTIDKPREFAEIKSRMNIAFKHGQEEGEKLFMIKMVTKEVLQKVYNLLDDKKLKLKEDISENQVIWMIEKRLSRWPSTNNLNSDTVAENTINDLEEEGWLE